MINVGVFGYGTVGSGVVEVLSENSDVIARKVGDKVCVKSILDLRDFPGDPFEDRIVHDVNLVVNDPEISIICETMGGVGAAYKFTVMALEAGKSVCTSNKELVAMHGPELLKLAEDHNCSYKFEASVGGGIPILRPLQNAITADRILKLTGIVNGTTNYMLTKMTNEAADFATVLKEAQEMGYAELHPEADTEGLDAGRKLAILSSLVYGKTVKSEDIPTEGISGVSLRDIKYAEALGRKIKLLAKYEDSDNGAYACVAPFMVAKENPLYNVDDVFNAILVRGNMLGDAMFYGKGAGKLPTASAVCSDVVECACNLGKNVPCDWKDEDVKFTGFSKSVKRFFVRTAHPFARDSVLNTFEGAKLIDAGFADELGFVTAPMSEEEFKNAVTLFGKEVNFIRFED
ncbi:MAG: homoserine dehydrogenase [Lachnospiraceae bacterium]|nr:homoserine dehydrogenase [Lachnospiraceae bacterium]